MDEQKRGQMTALVLLPPFISVCLSLVRSEEQRDRSGGRDEGGDLCLRNL